jgi:hypothetical protein
MTEGIADHSTAVEVPPNSIHTAYIHSTRSISFEELPIPAAPEVEKSSAA